MEFDMRRVDLVKASIKNKTSGQRIITQAIDGKIQSHWPKEDEYLGRESVFDVLVCNYSNWTYEKTGETVITLEKENSFTDGPEIFDEDSLYEEPKLITPPSEKYTEEIVIVNIKANARRDEQDLIELAKNHPEAHIRISAIEKIENSRVLCGIIKDDDDKTVKKACLDRLNELYIQ